MGAFGRGAFGEETQRGEVEGEVCGLYLTQRYKREAGHEGAHKEKHYGLPALYYHYLQFIGLTFVFIENK